jgi:hypothetical protein
MGGGSTSSCRSPAATTNFARGKACKPSGNRPLRGAAPSQPRVQTLPTLFRFLGFLAIVGAIVFGGMLALTIFVTPEQREMSTPIPAQRFNR